MASVLIISPIGWREPVQTNESDAVSGPRMEIAPETRDYGKVEQNEKLDEEFEIRNTGTEDLRIGRIATSCGLTATLTSGKVVRPGKTAVLKVTLETRRYKGLLHRSVSISSNDPRRIRTVRVKAFVMESTDASTKFGEGGTAQEASGACLAEALAKAGALAAGTAAGNGLGSDTNSQQSGEVSISRTNSVWSWCPARTATT